MSNPTNSPKTDPALPTETERAPAPDMLAELGPLAYGLFALAQPGELTAVRTLPDARAAQVPAQAGPSPERESRQDALLGELGALDL